MIWYRSALNLEIKFRNSFHARTFSGVCVRKLKKMENVLNLFSLLGSVLVGKKIIPKISLKYLLVYSFNDLLRKLAGRRVSGIFERERERNWLEEENALTTMMGNEWDLSVILSVYSQIPPLHRGVRIRTHKEILLLLPFPALTVKMLLSIIQQWRIHFERVNLSLSELSANIFPLSVGNLSTTHNLRK